jgi:hypothetical protein
MSNVKNQVDLYVMKDSNKLKYFVKILIFLFNFYTRFNTFKYVNYNKLQPLNF